MNLFTDAHLKAIAREPHLLGHLVGKTKLTSLHSDWIKYCWYAKESRALMAHRGSYKTTAIVEIGTIIGLLAKPDDRIAIVRKTFSDAAAVVQTISLMMKMPEVMELFRTAFGFYPRATTDREGKLLFNFKKTVTPEGSVTAHGLDYGLTGKHYDRIILDDFVTLKDRVSKAEREKSVEVLHEIIANIIDPGQPIIFVGTPWHRNDAWSICPEPVKYDVYKAGLLSDEEITAKKKDTTPVLYACNYELVHQSDEMALFRDPTFESWDYGIKNCRGQLDAAFAGDHYNALTFMVYKPDKRIQAVGFSYPGNVKDWLNKIVELYKKYYCREIWIEENADKGYTADALEKLGVKVKRYTEHENKDVKISTHGYRLWRLTDWSPETDDEYLEQCIDYREKQEPNDAPDSYATLGREAFNLKTGEGERWKLYN
jgi:hypothetical protein